MRATPPFPAPAGLTGHGVRVSVTRARRGGRLALAGHYLALGLLAVLFAFPFYWMFVTSLETTSHIFDLPPNFLPLWDWGNYADAWNATAWGRYFLNTVFIAATVTALVLLTSLLAAYAFAMLRFPGKGLLFLVILLVLVIPDEVILAPQDIILLKIGWLNTYQALIVPFAASPFGIFLLRQFFLGLPPELWDAAQIDGAGRTTYLFRVAAPLAGPALGAVALYTFLGMWNQFLYPLVIAAFNSDIWPIQVGLNDFVQKNNIAWTQLDAASVFTTLPLLVVFLLTQKTIINGVAASGGGAVKG